MKFKYGRRMNREEREEVAQNAVRWGSQAKTIEVAKEQMRLKGFPFCGQGEMYVKVPEQLSTPRFELIRAEITAYSASPDETDDTPDIVASGKKAELGMIACPGKYAFGTKVEIEGDVYTCEDRMNIRYRHSEHYDILVESKDEAYQWGRRTLEIKVYTN